MSAGKPPSAFPQDRLHIDFSQEVTMGRQLAAVVDGLLEPLVEDRLSADEALEMLQQDNQQPQSAVVQQDRWQDQLIMFKCQGCTADICVWQDGHAKTVAWTDTAYFGSTWHLC